MDKNLRLPSPGFINLGVKPFPSGRGGRHSLNFIWYLCPIYNADYSIGFRLSINGSHRKLNWYRNIRIKSDVEALLKMVDASEKRLGKFDRIKSKEVPDRPKSQKHHEHNESADPLIV